MRIGEPLSEPRPEAKPQSNTYPSTRARIRPLRSLSAKVLLAAGVLGSAAGLLPASASASEIDVSTVLAEAGTDPAASTIIVERLSDGQLWSSNTARSATRFSPASTSKIPHTLIALQTATAGIDTVFEWDGRDTWNSDWARDQTLTSAYRASAVWVFQDIVTVVGADEMAGWLDRLDYGNENTGDESHLTTYWLDGTLQISALEQVRFLTRLVTNSLPISPATRAAATTVMLTDSGPGWSLFAKTGWRHDDATMDIGWYVGWVECNAERYVFAFNMDMPNASDRTQRERSARAVLRHVGAFDCARS